MKKWIVAGIAVVLAGIGGMVGIYLNSTEPIKSAEEKAVKLLQQETDLTQFSDFQLYHGEESYYVLKARNEKEQAVYVWVSEKDKKIMTKLVSDGVKEDQAVKTVYADREPEQVISVKLGMARIQKTDRPAWEILYKTGNDNLNYYYVDFETGEKLRAIDNF
ncbi:cell wall elongation regulator TseB-like domain-containing protein [Mesobacillus foraminis]|uniref:cell wall elongation regulator TseB-like domain-containing protein n=1 Tax=Mesobacillus foraminis TaxID=279826 RepID=UPI000EF4A5BB|nr:DUF5590 domain-containing protein [Mesobacillus foraminis]